MSRVRKTTADGFTEVPLRLTEAEKELIRAFRAASSSDDAPRATVSVRGGRGGYHTRTGRPGPVYTAPSAGAASAAPKKTTWASITSKGIKHDDVAARPVIEHSAANNEKIAEKINLKKIETITTLTDLNSSGLFQVSNIRNESGTFKGLLVKIHPDVFKMVEKDEISGLIYTAMNAYKTWLTTNNETILNDITTNWSGSFLEGALDGADVVYTKRNTFAKGMSVLVGKKSNAPKAFIDDE